MNSPYPLMEILIDNVTILEFEPVTLRAQRGVLPLSYSHLPGHGEVHGDLEDLVRVLHLTVKQ